MIFPTKKLAIILILSTILLAFPGCNKQLERNPQPSPSSATPALSTPDTSADSAPDSSVETSSFSSVTSDPTSTYQKYMGSWESTDMADLSIWKTDNTYKFVLGVFRITTIDATAEIVTNNQLKFSSTNGPNINGTLEFNENSILVTIEESTFGYIKAGTTYNFTIQISADNPSETANTAIICDDQLCTADENVLFSFQAKNSQKVASICESKDQSYIVYRYGTKDNIELEYPEVKTNSLGYFTYYDSPASNDLTSRLSFENGGYLYTILTADPTNAKTQEIAALDVYSLSSPYVAVRIEAQNESIVDNLASLKNNSEIRIYH